MLVFSTSNVLETPWRASDPVGDGGHRGLAGHDGDRVADQAGPAQLKPSGGSLRLVSITMHTVPAGMPSMVIEARIRVLDWGGQDGLQVTVHETPGCRKLPVEALRTDWARCPW